MNKILNIKNLFRIVFGIFLIYFLNSKTNLFTYNNNYSEKGNILLLLFSCGMFFISFLLKFQRLTLITSLINKNYTSDNNVRCLFKIHTVSTIFSLVLPFKLGDIFRIYFLKNLLSEYASALSVVLFERIIDLVVIFLLLIIIGSHFDYLYLFDGLEFKTRLLILFLFIVMLYVFFSTSFFWYKIFVTKNLFDRFLIKSLFENMYYIYSVFQYCIMKKGFLLLMLTIVIWVFEILAFVTLYSYIDIDISLLSFIGLLTLISFALPAGPAGFGAIQLVFYYCFEIGLISENITDSGIYYSIYIYFPIFVILSFIYLILGRKKNRA